MQTFVIDRENNITAIAVGEALPEADGVEAFNSRENFEQLAAAWPTSRLVDIWNRTPGFKPIKKFTNRNTGLTRIWQAVQSLAAGAQVASVATEPASLEDSPTVTNRGTQARKRARKTKPRKPSVNAREGSKTARVLALLGRSKGTTLAELMRATQWQAHSVRGFLSGAVGKKMGVAVASVKGDDGERIYKIDR
jgi:hypothetical protein